MSVQYLYGKSSTVRDIDNVRLLIGDTDENNANMQDEEIQFFIDNEPNIWYAAAGAAIAIARKIQAGGLEDQKVGETRLRTKRAGELLQLAEDLRQRGKTHQLPYGGGVFVADRDAFEADDSLIQPKFKKGLHDFTPVSKSN